MVNAFSSRHKNKEVGGQLSYKRKAESHKQEDILWNAIKKLPRELTTELLYLELPTYFSPLQCYIRFHLTETS